MIFEKFCDLIQNQLGIEKEKLTRDADIVKDIGADSLDIVEMLMEVESEWGITIDDEVVQNLKTIGDVVGYIEKSVR